MEVLSFPSPDYSVTVKRSVFCKERQVSGTDKVYTIDEIISLITPVAKRYSVASVWLFGSYARGEATSESDVDLLIDGGAIHSLYQLSSFRLDLEDALQKPVDIVTLGCQDQDFVRRIRLDEVILYEAA